MESILKTSISISKILRKLLKQGDYDFWKRKFMDKVTTYPIESSIIECGYIEFINEEWGVFPKEWFDHYEDVICWQ